MPETLKILWGGLINAYDAGLSIVFSNLFFLIFLLPAAIHPLLLIFTIPWGIAGLFYTNYLLASGEMVDWKTFFEGIKLYWWSGIRWTLINGVVIFSLVFYFFLFVERSELWATALLGLDLGILALWVIMQFFLFPMMLIQEKPAYLMALRNTLVFIVRWPRFSFAFLMPIIILVTASLYLPPLWIFLSIGLVAFLSSYAVYYRIESDRHPELFGDPRQE